jgi:hypothetical protein
MMLEIHDAFSGLDGVSDSVRHPVFSTPGLRRAGHWRGSLSPHTHREDVGDLFVFFLGLYSLN